MLFLLIFSYPRGIWSGTEAISTRDCKISRREFCQTLFDPPMLVARPLVQAEERRRNRLSAQSPSSSHPGVPKPLVCDFSRANAQLYAFTRGSAWMLAGNLQVVHDPVFLLDAPAVQR
jgi:hypothetical protein